MLTLYVEHYRPQSGRNLLTERYAEMVEALGTNRLHPLVDRLVIFAQDPIEISPTPNCAVEVVDSKQRSYQSIFDYINARTGPDDIHVLVNADIALDIGFEALSDHLTHDDFYVVTRREKNGWFEVYPPTSQDAWIWRGKCRIRGANWHMGIRGCDNRLAADASAAGYRVSNPCRSLHLRHHHRSEARSRRYNMDFVPGPYLTVAACYLGETSDFGTLVVDEDVPVAPEENLAPRALSASIRQVLCAS